MPKAAPDCGFPWSSPAMNNNKKRRVMGEEDDPGPGQVGVQVRGSGRVFLLDKRSAVAKSDYFKSHLLQPPASRSLSFSFSI